MRLDYILRWSSISAFTSIVVIFLIGNEITPLVVFMAIGLSLAWWTASEVVFG